MSLFTKIAGVAAGVSTVAVLGVAIAQGQPPNPLIGNHAIGAGQQSTHLTPMGETGVLSWIGETRTAILTKEPEPVSRGKSPRASTTSPGRSKPRGQASRQAPHRRQRERISR